MTKKISEFKQPSLSTDIATITAEINAYKRVAGEAIFEIGRRLKHVKEQKLAEGHGGWTTWLREVEMSTSQADRFEKVFVELSDGKFPTSGSIALGRLYEIATLPLDERDKPQTIPSTGEEKRPNEMTVRELREVKAALAAKTTEASRKSAELAEANAQNEMLRDTVESLAAAPPRIEVKREVIPDPTLADRLSRYEARYGDIDGVVTERITNHTEVDGAASHFADDVQTLLMQYAHLTTFRASFVGLSDAAYDEYRTSLDALKEFINGMERVMSGTPRGKAEVIDIKAG